MDTGVWETSKKKANCCQVGQLGNHCFGHMETDKEKGIKHELQTDQIRGDASMLDDYCRLVY